MLKVNKLGIILINNNDKIKTILSKRFFFIIYTFILFFSIQGSSFVDDSMSLFIQFETNGWKGFFDSYGMSSLYWGHDFICILLYCILGKSNLLWFSLMVFLHAQIGFYLFNFLFHLLKYFKTNNSFFIAFFSSLLFLSSASLSENIFWIATIHYEISFLYLMFGFYIFSRYKGYLNNFYNALLLIAYPMILTVHEVSLFFPIGFGLLHFCYNKEKKVKIKILQTLKIMSPYFFFIFIYFLLQFILKESIIPHYGHSHLDNFSFYNFIYNLYKYVIKLFFFGHFFDFHIREKLYDVSPNNFLIFCSFITVLLIFFVYKLKKDTNFLKLVSILFLMTILFYVPISTMYFYWHFQIINDRLSYFLSPFLFSFSILIILKFNNTYGKILVMIFLILNIYFVRLRVSQISESIQFSEEIIKKSIDNIIDKKVIFINLPFAYKGLFCFRKPYRLDNYCKFYIHKNLNYLYGASMYFNSNNDSAKVVKKNDSVYNITIQSKNSWFMYNDIGASDIENPYFKMYFKDANNAELILSNMSKDYKLVYCTGKDGFKVIQ